MRGLLLYSFNLDLINCAVICFLSYLLRESPEYFFGKISNDSKNSQPRIVVIGTDFATCRCTGSEEFVFDIKIEDTAVCRYIGFVRTFLVMITLHYVFNVSYSKRIEATMAFI